MNTSLIYIHNPNLVSNLTYFAKSYSYIANEKRDVSRPWHSGPKCLFTYFSIFCITFILNSSFHSFAAFGCSKRDKLGSLCRYIAGDANLYTMFRVDGSAIECPFGTNHLTSGHPYSFSYDRGKGVCKWPESEMESCTDPSKLVFNYQACPNVPGSELMSKYFHG